MKQRFVLLFCCLSVLMGTAWGKHHSTLVFRQLPLDVRLSHYSVMALYQDERGLIWIGTPNGVDVYDGTTIRSYRHDADAANSLVSNSVRKIVGDRQGHIYIQTERGISRFDERSEQFSTLTYHSVTAMCYTDRLYKAVGNRVYVYDQDHFSTVYELPSSQERIKAIHTQGDSLLIGTDRSGLYVYDVRRHRLTQPIPAVSVSEIYLDRQGRYWIGTQENGLFRMEGSQTLRHFRHEDGNDRSLNSDFVHTLAEDQEGHIWVGTYAGLCDYDETDDTFQTYDLPDNEGNKDHASVWSLLCGRQGTMWVGSYFSGLSYFHPNQSFYSVYRDSPHEGEGLSFPVVGAMTEDDEGHLWICTEGGGLNMLDRKTGRFTWYRHSAHPNTIAHNTLKSLFYDRQRKELWIGTYMEGLDCLELPTGRFRHYPYTLGGLDHSLTVFDILPHGDVLLLATDNGVLQFDRNKGSYSTLFHDSGNEEHKIASALDLMLDNRGRLWVAGVENGTYMYDFSTHLLTHHAYGHNDPQAMSGSAVNHIFQDSQHQLWFCMGESGVDRYEEQTGYFYNYGVTHYLQGNCVYSACELTDHQLLFVTEKGFSVLNDTTRVFRNFDVKSGVPLSGMTQNALYMTTDGEVFLGGIDGMVSFRAENLNQHLVNYQVFPYRLFVGNREIHVNDDTGLLSESLSGTPSLALRSDQNSFQIQYAITDYVSVCHHVVQYKLEPLSSQWTVMRDGHFTCTNLPPGSYTLTVRAYSTSVEEAVESRLRIEVLSPWYATWPACLLYLFAATGLTFLLVRIYRDRIRKQTRMVFDRQYADNVSLLNQSKLNFFYKMTDEFRSPVTQIVVQVEELLQHPFQSGVQDKLSCIHKSGIRLHELVESLLDIRYQEQGLLKVQVSEHNLIDLLDRRYRYFQENARQRNIRFSFHKTNDEIEVWYDERQLQKVVDSLLSNAFKYTPDGGTILLSVRKRPYHVTVEVSDTGCGIDEKDRHRIFERFYQAGNTVHSSEEGHGFGVGLTLAKGIVELHHGTIDVVSGAGQGCSFVFRIPYGPDEYTAEERASYQSEGQ